MLLVDWFIIQRRKRARVVESNGLEVRAQNKAHEKKERLTCDLQPVDPG